MGARGGGKVQGRLNTLFTGFCILDRFKSDSRQIQHTRVRVRVRTIFERRVRVRVGVKVMVRANLRAARSRCCSLQELGLGSELGLGTSLRLEGH